MTTRIQLRLSKSWWNVGVGAYTSPRLADCSAKSSMSGQPKSSPFEYCHTFRSTSRPHVATSCIRDNVLSGCGRQQSVEATTSLSDDVSICNTSRIWRTYSTSVAGWTNVMSRSGIFKNTPGYDRPNDLHRHVYIPIYVFSEHP